MKKIFVVAGAVCVAAAFFSCKSLKDVDYVSLAQNIPTDTVSQSVSGSSSGVIDFKKGEVLCSTGECNTAKDCDYRAAKVQTPATPATKNQAEVLFVDGQKKWISYVIPSHKAKKAELVVGKYVFFSHGVSTWESCNQDQYRKAGWDVGAITDTSEMFKGIVEVKGVKCYYERVRVPDVAIK